MEKRAPRKALKYNVKAFVQLKTQDCKTFAQDKQSSRKQEEFNKIALPQGFSEIRYAI